METLGELFTRYGTDKGVNGYTSLYECLFSPIRHRAMMILEVGIGTMVPGAHSSMVGYALPGYKPGGSLRAWRDYFFSSSVHGIDVQPDTQFKEKGVLTHLCDSTDFDQVEEALGSLMFDVIIDDGSHEGDHQLRTLENLHPRLRPGGVYVIEDIPRTSPLVARPEAVGERCRGDPYFFAGLVNIQCVIRKRPGREA